MVYRLSCLVFLTEKHFSLPEGYEGDDTGVDLEEVRVHPEEGRQVLTFLERKTLKLTILKIHQGMY